MISTTNGAIYIQNIDSKDLNDKIEVQFVPVTKWNRTAKIDATQVVGKNLPQFQFVGGETTMSMKMDFLATENDRRDALRKVRWLEALTFNEGLKRNPDRVIIVFGDWLKGKVWHIKSVVYDPSMFNPNFGLFPTQIMADVVFGLEEDLNKPIKASDTRMGAESVGGPDEQFQLVETATGVENLSQNQNGRTIVSAVDTGVEGLERNTQGRGALRRSSSAVLLKLGGDVVTWTKLGFALRGNTRRPNDSSSGLTNGF